MHKLNLTKVTTLKKLIFVSVIKVPENENYKIVNLYEI